MKASEIVIGAVVRVKNPSDGAGLLAGGEYIAARKEHGTTGKISDCEKTDGDVAVVFVDHGEMRPGVYYSWELDLIAIPAPGSHHTFGVSQQAIADFARAWSGTDATFYHIF